MTGDEVRQRAHRLRSIPLEDVLRAGGARRDRADKAKWHTARGTISITGMKFMNWNQSVGGGGAIDLAIHLNGFDFKAALEWLARHFPVCDHPEHAPPPRRFVLPPPDARKLPAVKRYLVHDRALPAALLYSLLDSGRLYADTRGNAVFLLLGEENSPVGAELRGTTRARWRGMAPGSHKDLGYFSLPASCATTIVLCESAIDAISCFALYPDRLCISTSGARPNPRWLPSLLQQGYRVYCGFDSDSTGEDTAQKMMALYPNVRRLRPAQHDWNDVLKSHATLPLLQPPPQSHKL